MQSICYVYAYPSKIVSMRLEFTYKGSISYASLDLKITYYFATRDMWVAQNSVWLQLGSKLKILSFNSQAYVLMISSDNSIVVNIIYIHIILASIHSLLHKMT
jgi:hypothetical protein